MMYPGHEWYPSLRNRTALEDGGWDNRYCPACRHEARDINAPPDLVDREDAVVHHEERDFD